MADFYLAQIHFRLLLRTHTNCCNYSLSLSPMLQNGLSLLHPALHLYRPLQIVGGLEPNGVSCSCVKDVDHDVS